MAPFFDRYRDYRRIGFGPVIAFRFAWLVGRANAWPAHARFGLRR